jgi:hypothetical protein
LFENADRSRAIEAFVGMVGRNVDGSARTIDIREGAKGS